MTIEQKRVNKELLVILNKLNYIDKIPNELFDSLRKNQDEKWDFNYDDELPVEYQPMKKNTAILLSYIYLKYICSDQNEKEKLKQIYAKNEKQKKF